MQECRSQNAIKNSILGIINKIVCIIMPFITRTVIIKCLGMEYVGLNSLFSSVLQVLNLAELGISSAVVYCMYKPMAERNNEQLCALLNYMKHLYYIIGCVIIFIGIILIPFLPYLIKGEIPNGLNLKALYIIYLFNTGIGYFIYSYKSTLLNADQKVGVISNINSIIIIVQSVVQIFILLIRNNYYLYLVMMPFFTIINNIWVSWACKKNYPEIKCSGKISENMKRDITRRVKGLFVTRICTTTRNALDSIFISSFIGLTVVGIYGNYYYIMTAVISILNVITAAITASVGNSLVTETIEKNYKDMRILNFIFNWVVGFFTSCLLVMYQPFMQLWMGKTSLFSYNIVILICVYFYFLNIGSIRAVYHDAAGLWWEARYRAIFEAVLNILLNALLTSKYGVFGTILGTLISLILVNYIYGTQIVFKYYFKGKGIKEYFLDNLKFMLVTILACCLINYICLKIETNAILKMTIGFFMSLIMFNSIYFIVFRNTKIFKDSKITVSRILKRKYSTPI